MAPLPLLLPLGYLLETPSPACLRLAAETLRGDYLAGGLVERDAWLFLRVSEGGACTNGDGLSREIEDPEAGRIARASARLGCREDGPIPVFPGLALGWGEAPFPPAFGTLRMGAWDLVILKLCPGPGGIKEACAWENVASLPLRKGRPDNARRDHRSQAAS
jgi:hypothetical protein